MTFLFKFLNTMSWNKKMFNNVFELWLKPSLKPLHEVKKHVNLSFTVVKDQDFILEFVNCFINHFTNKNSFWYRDLLKLQKVDSFNYNVLKVLIIFSKTKYLIFTTIAFK